MTVSVLRACFTATVTFACCYILFTHNCTRTLRFIHLQIRENMSMCDVMMVITHLIRKGIKIEMCQNVGELPDCWAIPPFNADSCVIYAWVCGDTYSSIYSHTLAYLQVYLKTRASQCLQLISDVTNHEKNQQMSFYRVRLHTIMLDEVCVRVWRGKGKQIKTENQTETPKATTWLWNQDESVCSGRRTPRGSKEMRLERFDYKMEADAAVFTVIAWTQRRCRRG